MGIEEKLSPQDIITKIVENWFLTEPLLFGVYCTHKLQINEKINIPFRCGRKLIEYNPQIIKNFDMETISEYLKIEIIRILLKHPYQRMPSFPNFVILSLSSNITIQDNWTTPIKLESPKDFNLPNNLCFEEYYAKLLDKLQQQLSDFRKKLEDFDFDSNLEAEESDSNTFDDNFYSMLKNYQTSELWEENNEIAEIINAEIERAQSSNSWGSISGNLQQIIEASLIIQMDYRRMLSMFRASIISSKRKLTRMRPNRRYGFSYMGSQNDFTTGLLVGVDVSGSITDMALQQFFSIVNRFFKYGIKTIDVIQFDSEMKEEILSLKKAKKQIKIIGRGGTNFQPAIDYYEQHPMYDGLIMFTDGYADVPKLHRYAEKILWVLTSKAEYDEFCNKMLNHLPGSKATYIPL